MKDEFELLQVDLENSICICEGCNQLNKDTVYFPDWKTWYYIECQEKMKSIDLNEMERRRKLILNEK